MFQILLSGVVAIHFIYCLSLVPKMTFTGTFLRAFNALSPDVKKIVTKACYAHKYNILTEYDMSCEDENKTLIYATNLSASCIEKMKKNTGEAYFINTIFWYGIREKAMSLNVIKNDWNKYTHTQHFSVPKYSNVMIDGLNKDSYIVIACSNHTDSIIFMIHAQQESYGNGYGHLMTREKPIIELFNNDITAVMIHPTQNAITFANTKMNENNTQQNEIHIVENAYSTNDDEVSFTQYIYSYFYTQIDKQKVSPTDYYTLVDFDIKKITFFGGNTYIFLTSAGQLGMFWPTKNKEQENSIEWSLKKHISTFIDFAPDTTRRTKNGFTPYWAFLNDQGELFECDFLAQSIKPTLNFIKKILTPNECECFDKVYFNNKKCGVLYKNTDKEVKTSYTKLILYS